MDILWDNFVAWLISIDRRITSRLTKTHYLILTTKESYECGRTNNTTMLEQLHILAKKDKKNLVEVGIVYYFLFGQSHGLGWT